MLKENPVVPRPEDTRLRRWFSDDAMDLILWYDKERKLEGFQLQYDKQTGDHSVTWKRVDLGAGRYRSVLVSDGPMDKKRVAVLFQRAGAEIDEPTYRFVLGRLMPREGSSSS